MPDIVKRPGWNRQFKSHDKVNKRLMTGAEAAEYDANNRERTAAREARQEANIAYTASSVIGLIPLAGPSPPPPPPPPLSKTPLTALTGTESTPDNVSRGFVSAAALATAAAAATTTATVDRSFPTPGNEEEEEVVAKEQDAPIKAAYLEPEPEIVFAKDTYAEQAECVRNGAFAAVHSATVHSAFGSWRVLRHTNC